MKPQIPQINWSHENNNNNCWKNRLLYILSITGQISIITTTII